jgi:hypothetical protein
MRRLMRRSLVTSTLFTGMEAVTDACSGWAGSNLKAPSSLRNPVR